MSLAPNYQPLFRIPGSATGGSEELFGCKMKLSHITTILSTQIKVEAIPLSALPNCLRTQQANLSAYIHTIPFLCWTSSREAV